MTEDILKVGHMLQVELNCNCSDARYHFVAQCYWYIMLLQSLVWNE